MAAFINGRYFAMGQPDDGGRISVIVERTSAPGTTVTGEVVNGAWGGVFTDASVSVDVTHRTHPAVLLWQGDEIKGGYYGFPHVEAEIAAGRGVPSADT